MRLLFCTTPLDGHFRPLLPLARALCGRGHDVAFATAASWHPQIEAEGFDTLAAGQDHTTARAVRLDEHWDAIQEVPALARRHYVFSYLFAQGHAPLKLAELLDATGRWRPDAVVYESSDLAAPIAAAALGLPFVNHAFGTMASLSILERAAGAVAPLWRQAGLEPPPYAGAFEGGLYVDVVPPLLDGDRPLCPSVRLRLAGEVAAPPPWLETLQRPLVYATMGTVFNRPAAFAPLLEALAASGAGALVTVGRNVDPAELGPIPANVRVERFVPQAQVFASCDAVISHGGSGTLLGALAAGVPLVLLPQGADQFENAARSERVGAVVVVPPERVTADAIATALRLVLTEPAYAAAARRIAAEFEQLRSPDEVAAAVEEHVTAR